jgi:hypothetical protein
MEYIASNDMVITSRELGKDVKGRVAGCFRVASRQLRIRNQKAPHETYVRRDGHLAEIPTRNNLNASYAHLQCNCVPTIALHINYLTKHWESEM